MLRPYSIQDSHRRQDWLALIFTCGRDAVFKKSVGVGLAPPVAWTHTNAEMPVIFSPMISLWMSFVPS